MATATHEQHNDKPTPTFTEKDWPAPRMNVGGPVPPKPKADRAARLREHPIAESQEIEGLNRLWDALNAAENLAAAPAPAPASDEARRELDRLSALEEIGEATAAEVEAARARIANADEDRHQAQTQRHRSAVQIPHLRAHLKAAARDASAMLEVAVADDVEEIARLAAKLLEVVQRVEDAQEAFALATRRRHAAPSPLPNQGAVNGLRRWLQHR